MSPHQLRPLKKRVNRWRYLKHHAKFGVEGLLYHHGFRVGRLELVGVDTLFFSRRGDTQMDWLQARQGHGPRKDWKAL